MTKSAEAAGPGGGSGIQNQKQEPHTKMWGKITPCELSRNVMGPNFIEIKRRGNPPQQGPL